MAIGAVNRRGLGIDQQFRQIEAIGAFPGPFGTQSVARTLGHAGDEAEVHGAQAMGQAEAIDFFFAGGVEQADVNGGGVVRDNGDVDAIGLARYTKRRGPASRRDEVLCQVITEGSLRPVRSATPASERDRAMRSASAAWVSIRCFATSGSKRSM